MIKQAAPPVPRQAIVTALVLMAGGIAVIFDSTIVSIALADPGHRSERPGQHHPVGQHRVPARARRDDPGGRLGAGADRRQAAVDDRADHLPGGIGRLQPGLGRAEPDRVPGGPGHRRRHHDAADGDPGDPAGARRRGPRTADGAGQPARRARSDPRANHRRPHPERRRLALAVLGQRAVLPRRTRAGLAPAADRHTVRAPASRPGRAAAGLARHWSASCTGCPTSPGRRLRSSRRLGCPILGARSGRRLRARGRGAVRRPPWSTSGCCGAGGSRVLSPFCSCPARRCTARCCCCRCSSRSCTARTC